MRIRWWRGSLILEHARISRLRVGHTHLMSLLVGTERQSVCWGRITTTLIVTSLPQDALWQRCTCSTLFFQVHQNLTRSIEFFRSWGRPKKTSGARGTDSLKSVKSLLTITPKRICKSTCQALVTTLSKPLKLCSKFQARNVATQVTSCSCPFSRTPNWMLRPPLKRPIACRALSTPSRHLTRVPLEPLRCRIQQVKTSSKELKKATIKLIKLE